MDADLRVMPRRIEAFPLRFRRPTPRKTSIRLPSTDHRPYWCGSRTTMARSVGARPGVPFPRASAWSIAPR